MVDLFWLLQPPFRDLLSPEFLAFLETDNVLCQLEEEYILPAVAQAMFERTEEMILGKEAHSL